MFINKLTRVLGMKKKLRNRFTLMKSCEILIIKFKETKNMYTVVILNQIQTTQFLSN